MLKKLPHPTLRTDPLYVADPRPHGQVMRVIGLCGSLQARSSNLTLLERAVELAPKPLSVRLFDGLRDLPLFNPDITEVPPSVERWKRTVASADALLIACPEYGHSLPGALKNGIDWLIGSGEFYQKVAAITASVPESRRGRKGLLALATTLRAVDVIIVYDEPIVRGAESDGSLIDLFEALITAQPHAQDNSAQDSGE